jgi:hypothetical protein
MKSLRFGLSLFAVLSFALSLSADTGGSISGTIVDPTGAVVAGAKISLVRIDTNASQSVVTDSRGIYSFLELPVGTYDLQVDASGFKPYRRIAGREL